MRACRTRAPHQIRSMNLKRLLFRNKNPKFAYYLEKALIDYAPKVLFERRLGHYLSLLEEHPQANELNARLAYYHKQEVRFALRDYQIYRTFSRPPKSRVYYYDLKQYLKYFPRDGKFRLIPGDVRKIPEEPALVKSRPIRDDNQHSIIMKLNAVRHFNFIEDHVPFRAKMDTLFGRMAVTQPHRKAFFSQHFHNPKCDLGDVSGANPEWLTPKVSIAKHLHYKFVLALEGNDVATNLKWIMSSNSIAVMPRPKFETWFMEGKLIGGKHYIEISDDYSDLDEKLDYYASHTEECLEIVRNANAWCDQFRDAELEKALNLAVLHRYLGLSR
jgi:hypothetical protein